MRNDDIKKYLKIGAVVFIGYYLYKGLKNAGAAVSSVAELEAIAANSNVSKDRVAVCKDVAERCEKAIWAHHKLFGLDWLPWEDTKLWEDEPEVIRNLNRLLTVEECRLTSQLYQQVSRGKSLLGDVKKYLNASEQAQISTTVINNIS